MTSEDEVIDYLEDKVDKSVDWVIDTVTNKWKSYGGTLDSCDVERYPDISRYHRHEWRLVTVDLTWYADVLSKGALAGVILYYGITAAKAATLFRAITVSTVVTFLQKFATSDTYTFGAKEYDYIHPIDGRPYPAMQTVGSLGWDDSLEDTQAISALAGHPSEW